MDYKRLSGWKVVKWEEAGHGDGAFSFPLTLLSLLSSSRWTRSVWLPFLPSFLPSPPCNLLSLKRQLNNLPPAVFPHLYANLEGENVDSFLELKQSVDGAATGDTMWDAALEEARGKGWLLD